MYLPQILLEKCGLQHGGHGGITLDTGHHMRNQERITLPK